MKKITLKQQINDLRGEIKELDQRMLEIRRDEEFTPQPMSSVNLASISPASPAQAACDEAPAKPRPDYSEMQACLTLAHRHLEDARMRLGKVIQAFDGGESIYDR